MLKRLVRMFKGQTPAPVVSQPIVPLAQAHSYRDLAQRQVKPVLSGDELLALLQLQSRIAELRELMGLPEGDWQVCCLDAIRHFAEAVQLAPASEVPQGAVLSPLLANLYLHPLDQLLRASGYRLVRYADDFVVLCGSYAAAVEALELIKAWLAQAGLALHPEKTRLADLTQDGGYIDFLGYRFERQNGQLRRRIKPKKLTALKTKIRELTPRSSGTSMSEIIRRLNQTLRGVFEYFKHVSTLGRNGATELSLLDSRVRFRLRRLLGKRRGQLLSGRSLKSNQQWPNQYFHDLGLYSLDVARQSFLHAHRGHI